jgi:hypothetical protein
MLQQDSLIISLYERSETTKDIVDTVSLLGGGCLSLLITCEETIAHALHQPYGTDRHALNQCKQQLRIFGTRASV